jgi:hypothetical protein
LGADGDGLASGHGADGWAVVYIVGVVGGIVVTIPPVLAVVGIVVVVVPIAVPVVGVVVAADAQAAEQARDKIPLPSVWPVDRRGL